MKLVCPICQAEYPLEAALNDVAARQAVVRAFELTEIGSVLIRYVQLFKPAKQALSMVKLAKMLDELVPMIKQGQITRGGSVYAAPQAYWQQAIETMLASRDKLSLPLKSHGYLLEIITGYADKAAAKKEQQNEQGRKYGTAHTVGATTTSRSGTSNRDEVVAPTKSIMPEDVRKTLKKLTGKN